jgi:phosphate-selective porin OprO/OprP
VSPHRLRSWGRPAGLCELRLTAASQKAWLAALVGFAAWCSAYNVRADDALALASRDASLQAFLGAGGADRRWDDPAPFIGTDAPYSMAQAPPAELPSPPQPDLQSIQARLEALEKEVAASAAQAAEAKASEKDAAKKVADAAPASQWVDMSNEKWTVKLGGHVQMDFIHWPDHSPQIPAQDYFEFRRLRLMADGAGYGVYDFRLQLDAEPESGEGATGPVVDVKDAYFTMNDVPLVSRLRLGNFFVPTSLEQVTNDTNNIFMERSIPTQGIFSADREVGAAFYGVSQDKNFTYTGGVFLDSISESTKERIDDNQGVRVAGRLTWLPYYDEPSNGRYLIHTGANILYTDDQDDVVRFRARPQIHEGPFVIDSGPIAAIDYTTGGLEFATVWGQFSLQSEMFISSVNRIAADAATLHGAYVYGSYFLTGENRIYERYGQHGAQFARNVPYSNTFFVPGCCSWGAWEAKMRWSQLSLMDVGSGQYNDYTAGFNWYWTDRIRVMFDWIHPITSDGATPFGATHSDVLAMRFDFNW